MTNTNKRYIIVLVLATFLVIAVFSYVYINNREDVSVVIEPQDTLNIQEDNETTETAGIIKDVDIIEDETRGGTGVSMANPVLSVLVPDLNKPIEFIGEFTPKAKKEITAQINEISELLKKDTNLFNEWMQLGLLRKSIGDYSSARQIWEYASVIRPQNALSFGNLGILYGYYLQDFAQAEKNFLQSIENNPKIIYSYLQIADFYIDAMGDVNKAREILEKGLRENPQEEALQERINSL